MTARSIRQAFQESGLGLSQVQAEQFAMYHAELISWNVRANLISKRDQERILERHFIESALLSQLRDFKQPCKVLDLGTGGGFPGVPLKIMAPQLELTLVDSKLKKTMFLKELVEKLALETTMVVCDRAENMAHMNRFRNQFDIVVSRAVAGLPKLLDCGLPLIKPGGLLLAIKGSGVRQEVALAATSHPEVGLSVDAMPWNQLQHSCNLRVVRVRRG